jgi:hypothetical protein
MNALAEDRRPITWMGNPGDALRRLATVCARVFDAALPTDEMARVDFLTTLIELPIGVLDYLNEPVTELDGQGAIIQANPVAERLFRGRWPETEIQRIMALARCDDLPLPARISGNLPALLGTELVLWLAPRRAPATDAPDGLPAPATYWLIAPRIRPGQAESPEERTFGALIGDDTRRDIARLLRLLQGDDREALALEFAMDLAMDLDRTLGQLALLATEQQISAPGNDERLFPGELLRSVVERIAVADPSSAARIDVWSVGDIVAPIYGKSGWLKRAFDALLTRIIESCPDDGLIDIGIQQVGRLAVISGRHVARSGESMPADTPQPMRRRTVPATLQFHIARHVFELHGGQLSGHAAGNKPVNESGDDIVSFTLSLPTGTSMLGDRPDAICTNCPMTRQAHRYAADLAELLARP